MSDLRNRRVGRALAGFAGEMWRSLEADEAADVARFDVATLDDLPAPERRFLTAALPHSPMFEEPERTITILLGDVLNGTTSLVDTR